LINNNAYSILIYKPMLHDRRSTIACAVT